MCLPFSCPLCSATSCEAECDNKSYFPAENIQFKIKKTVFDENASKTVSEKKALASGADKIMKKGGKIASFFILVAPEHHSRYISLITPENNTAP